MKTKLIQLADIHNLFDVRIETRQDEDHILTLSEKLQAGEEFNPVTVTPVYKLPEDFKLSPGRSMPKTGYVSIDGRHTISAYLLLDRVSISCYVKSFPSYAAMIAYGMHANSAKGLPNTRKDDRFNILRMRNELGLRPTAIIQHLSSVGYTPKYASSRVYQVIARDKDIKRQQAIEDVIHHKRTPEEVHAEGVITMAELRQGIQSRGEYSIGKFMSNVSASTSTYIRSVKNEYSRVRGLELNNPEIARVHNKLRKMQDQVCNSLRQISMD